MHKSLYKKPSISTIIDQQQRYSIQQMQKIQQSNHKLNKIEEKMKSLLDKDNKSKYNKNNINKYQSQGEDINMSSKQINRYLQSSKKYNHHHTLTVQNTLNNRKKSQQSDDMLLQNNPITTTYYHDNFRQKHQYQTNNTDRLATNKNKSQISQTNRQKSTSSLKIFKKKKGLLDNGNKIKEQKNLRLGDGMLNRQDMINKNVDPLGYDIKSPSLSQPQFQSYHNHNNIFHSFNNNQSLPQFNPLTPIPPSSDVFEINQLQLMMQKSIEIKQKQLILAKQELQKLQATKLQQYRKNMQLQIEYQKIKKLKTQIKVNPFIIKSQLNQQFQDIKIIEQISTTRSQINSQKQKLLKQLKKLQQQEYNLKLQKKKVNFELGSMQRQFYKIFKTRSNKMKQNIQQNFQKYQRNNYQLMEDKVLGKKNQSVKTFRTNKKHSVSNFDHKQMSYGPTDRQRAEKMTVQKKIRSSKIDLSKSKQKFTTPIHDNTYQPKKHRVSKSTSCSVINRNRHTLAQCQHGNKNCETDKILFDMVHQLDKLKQIVNKQIVKTRAKKGQRRVIQLYDQRDNNKKEKIVMMR